MKASAPSSPSPATEVIVLRRRVPATTDRLVSIRPAPAEPESTGPASEVRAIPAATPPTPVRTRVRMVSSRPVPTNAALPVARMVSDGMARAEPPLALVEPPAADEAIGALTRLHERRVELLCLALLEPVTSTVLDAIAAELDKGEALIGSVVDEPELAPEVARQR